MHSRSHSILLAGSVYRILGGKTELLIFDYTRILHNFAARQKNSRMLRFAHDPLYYYSTVYVPIHSEMSHFYRPIPREEVTSVDIMCGRDKKCFNHTGTWLMHEMSIGINFGSRWTQLTASFPRYNRKPPLSFHRCFQPGKTLGSESKG